MPAIFMEITLQIMHCGELSKAKVDRMDVNASGRGANGRRRAGSDGAANNKSHHAATQGPMCRAPKHGE